MRQLTAGLALVTSTCLLAGACASTDRSEGEGEVGPLETTTSPSVGEAAPGRCNWDAGPPTTFAYAQVPGIDPNLLSVDLYGPPPGCGPVPVVFWIHGGGWAIGDKANEGTTTKAAWAAQHGWALVAVNYRLSTRGRGVVWPIQGEDAASAVGYVLDHGDELGIDPTRVALMGHSAGGHIASMIAVDPGLLGAVGHDRAEIDCLVSLDTEGYDLTARLTDGGAAIQRMVTNAFGADPDDLAAASPIDVVRTVGGPVPDTVIVTRGLPRRRAQAQTFASAMRDAGGSVTVVTANGYSHREVNHQLGTAGETVETPAVTELLGRCLA